MKRWQPKLNFSVLSPKYIDFKILLKPKVVNKALKDSTSIVRVVIIIQTALLLASFIFLSFGFYSIITKDIVDPNAELNEAVLMSFKRFNPLFDSKNNLEDRITKMLYTPLYTIDYDNSNTQKINTSYLIDKYSWLEDKPNQGIRFRLKGGLKFSNEQKITSEDIKFTFETIKSGQNTTRKYKKNFEKLRLNIINDLEYDIIAESIRPNLLAELDFVPVSKSYMENIPVNKLIDSQQTLIPKVTSGTYKISDKQINDIDYSPKTASPNPITSNDSVNYLILDKFSSNNTTNQGSSNVWKIKKYDTITSNNSQKNINIENDTKNNKVDLFIRQYQENSINTETPEVVKKALGLKQDITQNNWTLNAYFNLNSDINRTKPSTKSNFRKFVICKILNNPYSSEYYKTIKDKNRLIPYQINNLSYNTQQSEGCNNTQTNPELPTSEYVIKNGQLSFNNSDSLLNMRVAYLGYNKDFEESLKNTLAKDQNTPINTTIVSLTSDPKAVKDAFSNNTILDTYDIIIYPTENNQLKLNQELLKSSGANLLGNSSDSDKIEELNNKYIEKLYSTQEGEELAKLFSEKTLSASLYSFGTEINHSLKKTPSLDNNKIIGYQFNNWYTKSIKDWFFR